MSRRADDFAGYIVMPLSLTAGRTSPPNRYSEQMLPAVIRTDYSALPLYTYEGGFDPVRIACIFSKCYSLLEAPTSLKNALPPYSDH